MSHELEQQKLRAIENEQSVAERGDKLTKTLGVGDLVLTQILFIVAFPWVGVAAKQGSSHVVLWLAAITLFYIPAGIVVTFLNRRMPLEGGVYQWTKFGLGRAFGFLTAWNIWIFAVVNLSQIGLETSHNLGYIFGSGADGFWSSKFVAAFMTALIIGGLTLLTIGGLKFGKWFHKAGGVFVIVIFLLLIILPFVKLFNGEIENYQPFRTQMPEASWMTLNLLSKLGFGALGGIEFVAIHAAETGRPARSMTRAVIIAAPLVALMYILGTSAMLTLVPVAEIDLIAPIPQALSLAFASTIVGTTIVPLVISLIIFARLAGGSVVFAGNSRLPMVAGWDKFLPEWFTRIHPRFQTPVNSIVFVGAAALVVGIIGLLGADRQEAYQLFFNSMVLLYATVYLFMLAVPIFGLRNSAVPAPLYVKICAASAFLMTLLFFVFALFPIIEVQSHLLYAGKILLVILLTNISGLLVYKSVIRRT